MQIPYTASKKPLIIMYNIVIEVQNKFANSVFFYANSVFCIVY